MLIKKWMENNKGMTAGLFTTAVTVGVIEGCARLASSIIWTKHIQSSAHAVWVPEVCIMISTFLLILCHIIFGCYKWDKCCKRHTTLFSTLHILLPLHLIAFGLFYFLFPAIILVLAYPTQMIATLTFVLSYLFATTIFSASLFNICRNYIDLRIIYCTNLDKQRKQSLKSVILALFVYGGSFTLFCILTLYLHCIAILFLYSLLIGRGSAISTGPLAVISLLPSIVVSGVAWIVKIFTLNETKDTEQPPPEAKNTKQPSTQTKNTEKPLQETKSTKQSSKRKQVTPQSL